MKAMQEEDDGNCYDVGEEFEAFVANSSQFHDSCLGANREKQSKLTDRLSQEPA